ncbi:uncharacterized protein ACWYII_004092 isoform 2-T2 [Salvelinus alpinus]|uniref:uncharacterized protein isoform X2 n=1 Tax=Salvelinus alpinus TaxID=8036 RepID=UPI0039FDAFB8
MKMDGFREVAASEKERKPAGEESEEPSSELPSTSSGMLTRSEEECCDLETEISRLEGNLEVLKAEANRDEQSASTSSGSLTLSEECRDLETEISRLKDKLRFMKRTLDVPALLLTTLEEMNPHELKTFQWYLCWAWLPGCPPIPESQLENTNRQVTVDQMMKRYDHERAVKITLVNLKWMNRVDLAEKLERDHTGGTASPSHLSLFQLRPISFCYPSWPPFAPAPPPSFPGSSKELLSLDSAGSSGQLISQRPFMLGVPALLLTTLEELTEEQLKTFQSHLTSSQLPDCSPIPESQLENTDRQVTVDQMVKRYDPERAVKITLMTLKWMNRVDLAEKLERDHTRDSRPVCSQALYPPSVVMEKPYRFLPSSVQHSLQRPQILSVPALLLTTLEELTEEQLKTFQSNLTRGKLPDCPPIPERQLENTDRQVTVDQMVKRYDHEGAVRNTVRIMRRMKRVDLAEKLERDPPGVSITATTWWRDSSDTGNDGKREKKQVRPARSSRALDREAAGSKDTGITKDKYELVTKPTEKKREALLLATLEELSTDELKIFQKELTPSKQLPPYLTGFPPIPETQLENADRQVTADQMVKRYGPEGAVEITQRILRRMNQEDLAEKFERYHSRGKKRRTSEEPSWPGLVSRGKKIEDCVQLTGRAPFFIKHKKTPKLEMDFSTILGSQLKMANSLNTEVSVNTQENTQRMGEEELGRERESPLLLDHHHMSSPDEFTPEIHDQDNRGEYRFQCPRAGLFQCSITGLVFRMEGEGEVLYKTVHWDMRFLSQNGKRPAGPLFKFRCLKGSVCQLHLPHCEIYNSGGCHFLSVAHVTDDNTEFLPPLEITGTHIIINISGFSAYGEVKDEDSPTVPIRALVLLFYKPPVVPEKRSILNVLLLPRNVVIREVQEEWKRRNGDKYIYIETNPRCQLTPNKEYELSADLPDEYLIQPKDAEFVDFESYENYFPTFQLFIQTVVEQVNILLKDNGGEESVWERLIWLPASPTDGTSTVSAVSPAAPPANPSAPPVGAFIRRHRMSLETRLGLLQPLFLRLRDRGVLIDEEREEVVSKSTKTLQNQALLDMVVRKGARAQEHFYQVLKEVDPCLVEDLEEQTD